MIEMRRIAIGLASALAFAAIAAATATVGAAPEPQTIKLSVKKFEYSLKQITVKKGTPVTIEISSEDRQHGFNLPDFNVRADINPGKVSRVTFIADKAGEFDYLCDIFCGDGHEDVNGKLIVQE
jgi:cytochrome c oxidase subunit II